MTPSAIVAGGVRKGTLTRELIIEKILRWNALFGEPPCTADWNPSLARWRAQEWRIERYYDGDPETGEPWPALNTAKRRPRGHWQALPPEHPQPALGRHRGGLRVQLLRACRLLPAGE